LLDPAGSHFQIDTASEADASALRELHVLSWADAYVSLLTPAFYRERLSRHRERDWTSLIRGQQEAGGGVLVARGADGLLGLCQYGPSEDDDELSANVGHIHRLYVHPVVHRHGVGRVLLLAAAERLTALSPRRLTLWVLENDPRARAFYERLGWRADGARRFDGAWDLRYRKDLAQTSSRRPAG
jgi:GNAT superfamily N-acetyltransferase